MKLLLGRHLFLFKHRFLDPNVRGISSLCEDGKHVLFFDLDSILLENYIPKLRKLQLKHRLSTFYIFETSNPTTNSTYKSYHIICLDKLSFGEVMDIMSNLREELRQYIIFGAIRNKWVLRFSKKAGKIPDELV